MSTIRIKQLPRVCVALGCSRASELRTLALHSVKTGERFLEFRLDLLNNPQSGLKIIRQTLQHSPRTIILATCRQRSNGGAFDGSQQKQFKLLEQAIAAGAKIIDLEIESAEQCPTALKNLQSKADLIVSYHNFLCTPNLGPVVRRLKKIPADIYKIATTAQKPSDNLRVLELPARHPETKLVVMAMGKTGMPTRILGSAHGSMFTFASPEPIRDGRNYIPSPTAPGQITSQELRGRYRSKKLSPSTQVLGIVACPAGHSMSPALHNRLFQSYGIDAVFLPFEVAPNRLRDFFQLVERLPVTGLSVTIPHKCSVIRYLDSLDPLANRIGAVNTIFRHKKKLCGTNTDAVGVTTPLNNRISLKRASVLVIGNGGAARAAVFALKEKGAQVTLSGRNPQRVRALAKVCEIMALNRNQVIQKKFDALVHATPVGMHPQEDQCFFEDVIPADLVFDMVYNPLETLLLKKARSQGKSVIQGLEMFLEQAAAQSEIWTGQTAPRGTMKHTVLKAIREA